MATATKTTKTPEIGMGATYRVGSDSTAFTIIEVSASGKRVVAQEDDMMIVNPDGMGNGDYVTMPDPEGRKITFTLRKNGAWKPLGSKMTDWWIGLSIGQRHSYRDPSF